MTETRAYATGGCQCGAVRYRASLPLGRANYCHCRMCQRATGNPFAVLVSADAAFTGTPARYASSDVAERGFCRDCGTPLFYAPAGSDQVELMTGTLDEPSLAEPALHYGVESMMHWLRVDDDLPRHATRPGGLSGNGPEEVHSRQSDTAEPAETGLTGGCQCGAVRYALPTTPERTAICHCRMCQRATGNILAVLANAPAYAFEGTPARFASSDVAERGFCADCGTPLFYHDQSGQGMNLMIGTFDDPAAVTPTLHCGAESRMPWFRTDDGLPTASTQPGGLTGRTKDITSHQDPAG